MKKLSLTEAAKASGRGKSTISKAIKTGRLSAEKVGNQYHIDPAELFRVYPIERSPKTESEHIETPEKNAPFEIEIKMLREQLERERDIVDDLRQDRDKWRQQATALLENKTETRAFWTKVFKK